MNTSSAPAIHRKWPVNGTMRCCVNIAHVPAMQSTAMAAKIRRTTSNTRTGLARMHQDDERVDPAAEGNEVLNKLVLA